MINTDIAAKMLLQPPDYLRSQRNFGQHVQHLFTLFDIFLDQADVYIGLTTGGYSMEQANRFCQQIFLYLIECLFLRFGK